MSRVAISLDAHALIELQKRAAANKEPVSKTAARMVRDGLLSTHTGPAPTTTTTTTEAQPSKLGQRPSWVEPATEPQQWRRDLWAAVVALHDRYPRAVGRLPASWTADRALVETLAALVAWRSQLDAGLQADPRAELLFHDRLEILERQLTQSDDPTAVRFTGGAPPSDWVA